MVLARGEATGHSWDGHLLLLHGSEADRESGLLSWVRRGLENNEKVIYSRASAQPEARSVEAILRRHGIDVAGLRAKGRLAALPLIEFYPPGVHARVVERALAEGYRAVRVTCTIAALSFLKWPAYADMERELDTICRALPLSALCQCRQTAVEDGRLWEVTDIHLDGIRQRLLTTSFERGGLALAGEVDMSNESVLASAVQAAVARAGSSLHLELSQLRFLSAAGCRVLGEQTRQFRDRGGRLVLIAPPNGVAQTLLCVLGGMPNVDLMRSRGRRADADD